MLFHFSEEEMIVALLEKDRLPVVSLVKNVVNGIGFESHNFMVCSDLMASS